MKYSQYEQECAKLENIQRLFFFKIVNKYQYNYVRYLKKYL